MADAFANGVWGGDTSGSRALSLWMPRLVSAETEYTHKRDLAAARARDLATSSAYGANATRIHRDNVIGPTFRFACRPMYELLGITIEQSKQWARLVEREWEAYANSPTFDCDAARVLTFPWLLHMAYVSYMQSGEALAVLKWKPSPGGYNTCLMMIEPERLSNPANLPVPLKNIWNGVECDNDGAPIAYHIRNVHPSDVAMHPMLGAEAWKWTRVPRSTEWGRPMVLHMMDRARPDMRRGISKFVSALRHMKMVDSYDEAELESAVLRASFAAVVKTTLPREDAMGILGGQSTGVIAKQRLNPMAAGAVDYMRGVGGWHKEMGITLGGARAIHLLPGEDLELKQAAAEGLQYEAFQKAVVRKIAAGVGTSAEQLSRDFAQMSFASARMSLIDIWRHFLTSREMVVRQLAIPYACAWLEEAIDSQRLPLPNGKVGSVEEFLPMRAAIFARSTFMSWGPPQVDPVKEVEGMKLAVDNGFSTLEEEAYSQGHDWEELLEQRGRERDKMKELGIPLPEDLPPKGGIDLPPGATGKD